MIRFALLAGVLLLLAVPAAGCTDFVEPNQLAFVMGSGMDDAGDGLIEVSHQIVIPSRLRGGSSDKVDQYIVMSAKGKNLFDATQKIQLKLSRRLMTSHRILIAFGESYVKQNDIGLLYDKIGRDPTNSLRDAILLIRGGTAKEFLMQKHPMEFLPSVAAGKELQINGLRKFSARQLVIDSLTGGTRPLLPFLQIEKVELSPDKKTPIAALSGFAVLDEQRRIKGYLDETEGKRAVWMSGKGTFDAITVPWKDTKGTLSFRLTHIERKLRAAGSRAPERVGLTVKAQAYLLENTTALDMAEVDNMIAVQHYLNAEVRKQLQGTMDKVRQWGSDVFGVGEYLHHTYPYWWKTHKTDWDEGFKRLDVAVETKIQLRSVGTIGAPYKTNEEKAWR
ncbi:Ger(x)C family spore germination protein [Paenibacillus sp. MWE-103]|uniref:Ger(X)C family spore germination protein n=1 Tax=Paenibacillus artemisiicola TaxID=1172618 RepID=A0ABS3WFQ5_9BACL|nr:Ger(x)C family spore germination protein [Paenibacillus artemisiicola]MBO7747117.1 Ger(x)C family spore germination protein [Paenibacillus artemisiicola]